MTWFGPLLFLFGLFIIGLVVYLWPRKELRKQRPEEKPHSYQDQAQPGQGVVKNIGTRFTAKSDAKTQTVVNEATAIATEGIRLTTDAVSADLENRALPERHEQTLTRESADTKAYLAQKLTGQKEHQLRERLIDLAIAQGFDVDTYIKQRLNDLDIEKLEREAMVKLKGGFIYQLRDYQKLTMLRSNLDELYEREHLIEIGDEPESVKQKKLAQVRADIITLEQDANGRRQGLLQAFDGDGPSDSDPDTEY
jgi:hypothetical protein